jgi:hypothetical protein
MSIVPIVNISEKAYVKLCEESRTAEDKWKIYKECSSFTNIEGNLKLVIFHEIFFRVYALCWETKVSFDTATAINGLFQGEVQRLACTPGSDAATKEEAAQRCKELVSNRYLGIQSIVTTTLINYILNIAVILYSYQSY